MIETVYDVNFEEEKRRNDPTTSFQRVAEQYRNNVMYKGDIKVNLYRWDDSIEFHNTLIISKAAQYHKQYGRYNNIDPKNDPVEWRMWWDREEYRRVKGITLPIATRKGGGLSDKDLIPIWIPGKMYGHLNYGPINRTADPEDVNISIADAIKEDIDIAERLNNEDKLKLLFQDLVIHEKGDSEYDFPDFWDGHYHLWVAQEFADRIGLDIIIFKARRKGMSYIGAWDAFDTFDLVPYSNTLLIAHDFKYLTAKDKLYDMVRTYSSFINKHTDWAKSKVKDTTMEMLAGYKFEGQNIDGFKSSVMALSAKDNPDCARGVKATKVKYEECFSAGTKIRMADHSLKNIEEIKVGDYTLSPNGKRQKVISVINGVDDLFEVKQSKGVNYIVNSKHKLVIRKNTAKNKHKCEDLITPLDFLSLSETSQKQHIFGYKSDGFKFSEKDLPLEPYWLGLWLGDGDKSRPEIVVNIDTDIEILNYLKDYANRLNVELKSSVCNTTNKCKNFLLIEGSNVENKFNNILKNLGIYKNKKIPTIYIESSEQQRLELLAGIIDSDGYNDIKGKRFEVTFTDQKLAAFTNYLVISLGLRSSVTVNKLQKRKIRNTIINNQGHRFRIQISGMLSKIPTKLPRKKGVDTIISNVLESKLTVTNIGTGRYYGITVEGDHKLLLEDNTVVHNCGTFPNLAATIESTSSASETGAFKVGQSTYWATIGSDEADYVDFASFYYNPMGINCLCFDNIYDPGKKGTHCGMFFSHLQNYEGGGMDKDGNSLPEKAKQIHEEKRKVKKATSKKESFDKWDSERVTVPEVALFTKSNNIFSSYAKILNDNIQRIDRDPAVQNLADYGIYTKEGDKIKFISNDELEALGQKTHPPLNDINKMLPDNYDMHGCIVEWGKPFVYPVQDENGNVRMVTPPGIYSIWHDPYATDKDADDINIKDSVGAAYVYERVNNITPTGGGRIVASWIGRPESTDDYNEQLWYMAIRWNTYESLAFENDRGDVISFFKRKKATQYLMFEPELEFLKNAKGKTGRNWGISIGKHPERKGHAARIARDMLGWTVTKDSETREEKIFAQYILCKRLNRELLIWSLKGNFDCVSAYMVGGLTERQAIFDKVTESADDEVNNRENEDFWTRDFFQ